MKRGLRLAAIVVATQAVAIGVYQLVEHQRIAGRFASAHLRKDPPEPLDLAMPGLLLRERDGDRVIFRAPARKTLVHFWATWCPPCRAELPGLLALPDEHPIDVLAVALDDDWASVERFLDGRSMSDVRLGDAGEVQRVLGVRTLPVTFFVEPSGRISLWFEGARDWTDAAFLRTWSSALTLRRERTPGHHHQASALTRR